MKILQLKMLTLTRWQAVHHPHEGPPDWPEQSDDIGSYRGMLWGTDRYVGELTSMFKAKGMYDTMLIVYRYDECLHYDEFFSK